MDDMGWTENPTRASVGMWACIILVHIAVLHGAPWWYGAILFVGALWFGPGLFVYRNLLIQSES